VGVEDVEQRSVCATTRLGSAASAGASSAFANSTPW
jgi:hypothetical protein